MRLTIATIALLSILSLRAEEPLEKALGPVRAKALGVGKLSQEERAEWVSLLKSLASGDNANSSASAYLKSQGWKDVTVHGERRKGLKTYLVVSFGFLNETYAVESPITLSITPGRYLGKISPLGDGLDSIIDTRGREHRFYLETWIKLDR